MAHLVVAVPLALAPSLRETVLLQYRATVEALHLGFGPPGDADSADAEVSVGRERLTRLGDLLDQLDPTKATAAGTVRLEADMETLRDALHGSLIDAGERLAVACGGAWRGEASAGGVRTAAEEVIALDRLLREVEDG
jgi:hypothetical protein